jgi:hypothetical protein
MCKVDAENGKDKPSRNQGLHQPCNHACLSREKQQTGPLRGQGLRAVPQQKGSDLPKGLGTYKEAYTNIKISYLQGKLS